jgi:hypothetical protein
MSVSKSLSQLIGDYQRKLVGDDDPERSIEELNRLGSQVAATREAGASIETRFMRARSFFDTDVLACYG